MKELEKMLKKVPLTEPGPGLDQRVEAAVVEAEQQQRDHRPRGVPLWAFATGCLACTIFGFLAHPLVERPDPIPAKGPSVVYIVEPSRPDLRIFGTGTDRDKAGFWNEKRTDLKPLVRN